MSLAYTAPFRLLPSIYIYVFLFAGSLFWGGFLTFFLVLFVQVGPTLAPLEVFFIYSACASGPRHLHLWRLFPPQLGWALLFSQLVPRFGPPPDMIHTNSSISLVIKDCFGISWVAVFFLQFDRSCIVTIQHVYLLDIWLCTASDSSLIADIWSALTLPDRWFSYIFYSRHHRLYRFWSICYH